MSSAHQSSGRNRGMLMRNAHKQTFGLTVCLAALATLVAATASASSSLAFGPKTFTISAGGPQAFTELIALDSALSCDSKAAYILVAQNGGIASATVSLNGATPIEENAFKPGQGSIERPVVLAANNTLGILLKGGKPGSTLTLSIRRVIEEPVQGPKEYRLTGKSLQTSESFSVPDPASSFTLVVRNGDAAGQHRIRSGSISVNGSPIVSQQDLGGDWPLIRKSVTLQSANTLSVDLRADAGDVVEVSIVRQLDENACGPHVFFSTPAENQTVTSGKIAVTGTATGVSDLGIQVNDVVAQIDLSHAGTPADPFLWFALVPAAPGNVTLSARLTDGQRGSASASRSIVFAPTPEPLVLTAPLSVGVAPFQGLLQPFSSAPAAIQSYSIDFDGDGIVDASGTTLPAELSFTYQRPGLYQAVLRATDGNGVVTSAAAYVVVQSFASVDRIVVARWKQLQDALSRQDVDAAAALFAGAEAKQKYRDVFTALFARLPAIAQTIERPRAISIDGDTADYLVRRTENGRVMGYHMTFVRDVDGVWRIADF
ncbi:MAG TPA: PKD domain-containing protein [Thermoanaerobaculia bacterium]|nr:PKD domain-containing protein [Thermoanaerobaculia bacterium]